MSALSQLKTNTQAARPKKKTIWTGSELLEAMPGGSTRGWNADGTFKGWDTICELDSDDDYTLHPDVPMWCEEEKKGGAIREQIRGLRTENVEMTERENKVFMRRLARKAKGTIRRAGHSEKKKPVTTLKEPIPRKHLLALLGDRGTVVSNTKLMHRRLLKGKEVAEWLGIDPTIEACLFTGPFFCCIDEPDAKAYRDAEFESLEIKSMSTGLTTFKFRTFLPRNMSARERALLGESVEFAMAKVEEMMSAR